MKASGLAMSGLLMMVMLLAGCDRGKPGNPMPPQKPPMPKTVGLIAPPGADASVRPACFPYREEGASI